MLADLNRDDELYEMAQEESDEETAAEVAEGVEKLEKAIDKLDFQFLLSGEEDERGAVLEIHPGAGGTESADWAQMLLRMFLRWAERRGFKAEIVDRLAGEAKGGSALRIGVNAGSLERDLGPGGEHQHLGPRLRRPRRRFRRLFQDDVGVGAPDAKRADAGSPWSAVVAAPVLAPRRHCRSRSRVDDRGSARIRR